MIIKFFEKITHWLGWRKDKMQTCIACQKEFSHLCGFYKKCKADCICQALPSFASVTLSFFVLFLVGCVSAGNCIKEIDCAYNAGLYNANVNFSRERLSLCKEIGDLKVRLLEADMRIMYLEGFVVEKEDVK